MPALDSLPTDIHVHIQPWERMHKKVFETIKGGRKDYAMIEEFMASADAFVNWMDEIGLGRAGLINYVAPDIMGFEHDVNDWVSRYRDAAPDRLIAFGGIHPPAHRDVRGEMKRIVEDLRLDALKIHPPHQALSPDAYATGHCPELRFVYEACEAHGLPIMFHTGTSIFPGARSRLGKALVLDDVAVDFPDLKIILAHGGRPLWMDEAFFLLRRHPNVYMDISGIPPTKLLEYFPRLEQISHKALFGTDWPSPGVKSLKLNMGAVRNLPISDEAKDQILVRNALKLFPIDAREGNS